MTVADVLRKAKTLGLRTVLALARIRVCQVLRIPTPMRTADRLLLEQTVMPHYAARPDVRRVLFVGCDSYTWHYKRIFRRKEYWTIEPDARRARFGSTGHHVVDGVQRLEDHFAAGFFDVILCNGVFGWGLDEATDCEAALDSMFACLREGGELVLGWNDLDGHRPPPLDQLKAWRRFEGLRFPPLDAQRHRVAGEHAHVYDFLLKPAARAHE